MNENTNDTTVTTTDNQPKKRQLTKVIFYLMAILLIATTAMCAYMSYNLYQFNKKDASASGNNTVSDTIITDSDTDINDKTLSDIKDEAYYLGRDNVLSSIKSMMENGETTLQMLRTLYPEYLIYNQTGGFVFKEIDDSLAMNNYEDAGFKITENEYGIPTNVEYYKNDTLASYTGIDVSKHNGDIDWSKVKASGIDFAILRAGNRGYGNEGKLLADDSFEKNATAATENGISIGAYIFSEAITVEEAIEEAELVLSLIEPYDITYPVIIDIEEIQNDDGRNEALSPAELTDVVLAFCNRIKEAGYTPMIYCNLKGFIGMLEFERLEGIEKWYAYYGNELYFPYDVSMWQYSSTGKVDGITGDVDLNISFKNYAEPNS